MRPFASLIGSAAVLAIVVGALPRHAETELDWKVGAAEICETKHSYHFYHRFSSTFEVDVAGPMDAIESSDAAFHPKTGKAEARSVWKSAIGADATPWQELAMVATCEADPWLFPKSVAKCGNFQGKGTCTKPQCTSPDASPPFRVPAGVFKDKPLPGSAIPRPKFIAPAQDQAAMVLEVPVQLEAGMPRAPYCSVLDVAGVGSGGATVAASWRVADGPVKGVVSFVGKPQGKWMLTATPRQYTGKPDSEAWTPGTPESRGFYVGPSWPGAKEKPVSVTMLKVISPVKGTSVPAKGGALTISIHQDLRNATNPKRVTLTWQYVESPLPGTPWPGQSVLPAVLELTPQMKSPSAPNKEWLNYQKPLDFTGQTTHKNWKLRACVRAYDSDLCQESAFTLVGS